MQVVLLAAGLGSRLGALTERVPKALIEVDGQTLIARAIRFAMRVEPSEVIVVGGFGYADVRAELDRRRLDVRLVENPSFRDGNLVSLAAARPFVRGDFLLMNVDHIYRPAIAERVRLPAMEVTAFVDVDRPLMADDMKVQRDAAGQVHAIAKTLTEFDAGYVGMTRVPERALGRYWAAADSVIANEGRTVHVERILARLADSPEPPHCRDISGFGWLEVDLPDERAHAESVIRAAPAEWA